MRLRQAQGLPVLELSARNSEAGEGKCFDLPQSLQSHLRSLGLLD